MSLVTIEGTFKDGKINLAEAPSGVEEARVLVTFLPMGRNVAVPRYMTFGQLRVSGRPMSTEEDFKLAEWHPKPEDLDAE